MVISDTPISRATTDSSVVSITTNIITAPYNINVKNVNAGVARRTGRSSGRNHQTVRHQAPGNTYWVEQEFESRKGGRRAVKRSEKLVDKN